MFNYVKVSLQ